MSLSFYRKICKQLLDEDGLLLMGTGLGLDEILSKFVKLYCSTTSQITIALNVPQYLQSKIVKQMTSQRVKVLPKIVQENTSSERYFCFLQFQQLSNLKQ
jgi:hypothetical protein